MASHHDISDAAAVQSMMENFPDASDQDLIRFLKARNHNVAKATAMYQAHLDWRHDTMPMLEHEKDRILETLATRKFYLLDSADADGRPVVVYCLRRFVQLGYDVTAEEKALIYLMEYQLIPRLDASTTNSSSSHEQQQQQKYTALIDVSGIRSPPLSFLTHVNGVMEANYPERLHRSILFPVPSLVQKMIRGMLYFVAQETREKFAYVNTVSALEECAKMPASSMGDDVVDLVHKKAMK
ncbi:MAG: hypothetical protein SGILL_005421 [Bacillariaceae sp.]